MDKLELRADCLARRRALSGDEAARRSAAVHARLVALPEWAAADCVLTYLSSMDNEVDTLALVGPLLERGIRLLVPVCRRDRRMDWSELRSLDEVARTRFGIFEPTPENLRPADPPENAVALVPGIAFTRTGDRIGYGAGYYDRFLGSFRGLKIGLAFDLQLVEAIPTEPHDVPLDILVTESAVYRRLA